MNLVTRAFHTNVHYIVYVMPIIYPQGKDEIHEILMTVLTFHYHLPVMYQSCNILIQGHLQRQILNLVFTYLPHPPAAININNNNILITYLVLFPLEMGLERCSSLGQLLSSATPLCGPALCPAVHCAARDYYYHSCHSEHHIETGSSRAHSGRQCPDRGGGDGRDSRVASSAGAR